MARIINDSTVKINGRAAAKLFDEVTCGGHIIQGHEKTWIDNLPASRLYHKVKCPKGIKIIVDGSNNTMIESLPAGRFGDPVE